MKICKKCGASFPIQVNFNGKIRNFGARSFCLKCSPFGSRNTTKLISPRPSRIDSLTQQEFTSLIKDCQSRSEIFKKLEMRKSGAAFFILNRRISRDNIDISHFLLGGSLAKNRKYDNNIMFSENSLIDPDTIKKRIKKDKLLVYECFICKMKPEWNGRELVFQLDHINGIRNDNRLDNLRWLCPNCHSQTKTFCRKMGK